MGREVRKVPPTWEHPKDERGNFIPLLEGFSADAKSWDEEAAAWARGEFPSYADEKDKLLSFEDWSGKRPIPENYMPEWPAEEATHFQMYETCSEGTPISPVMSSPEELARWLTDTGASAFGSLTASYEKWLRVCQGGYASSAVVVGGNLTSGVEGL